MKTKLLLLIPLLLILAAIWPFVQRPQQPSQLNTNQSSIEGANEYLEANLFKPNFGGKVFCAHKSFGQNGSQAYVWVLCEEYYVDQGAIESGTGRSGPVVLKLEDEKIKSHEVPGDGTKYGEDIKRLFPPELYDQIINFSNGNLIVDLSSQIQEKVRTHFDVKNKKIVYTPLVHLYYPASLDGWKTYANNEFGFSIRYPDGWKVNDDKLDNDNFGTGVVLHGPEMEYVEIRADITDQSLEEWQKSFDQATIEEIFEPIFPAQQYDFESLGIKSTEFAQRFIAIKRGNKFYVIQSQGTKAQQEIIATLEFVK